MKSTKIVVAYSGGLDTSVMVKWLIERKDAEVIAATGDLGQKKELNGVQAKAYATGASKVYVRDLREEFLTGYVWPALKAGAVYEKSYPMATALGRPLLAKMLVDIARKEGATHVAHGCTGKGNDQVRFEVSVAALAPDLKVLAPCANGNSNHAKRRSPTRGRTTYLSRPPWQAPTLSMRTSGGRA
jgi:argininosuccinate synthase